MTKLDWFERPARWLDKTVDEQTEDVQNRIPVDDVKLGKLRDTKRVLRNKETRFAANLLWWLLVFVALFNFAYIAFAIFWMVI